MATAAVIVRSEVETLADLVKRLGNVPLERIRMHPAPGTATEEDVLVFPDGVKRLCELVDGVLVEKPMGLYESFLASVLGRFLQEYLDEHDLGIVTGESGPLRLKPGLVRMPDVCFIAWEQFTNEELTGQQPIPDVHPDLAVEVLSKGNTEEEMDRKLREYFAAGARLVWYVEPKDRTVRVYTSPTEVQLLHEDDTLDGGSVLPGFRLQIRDWFDRAKRRGSRSRQSTRGSDDPS
jgi:Uma2 family endonuclease